ncbi:hypothetical protein HOLleu_08568 [Holothuria leucospilota]|uniref:Uncharacterized protein n=1 Tax=Holothuria leucospilota TaxID=206669 RepID=A0A9Q1HGF3_HOLLE|nr:hypothetical protein HOLleu_08568 [Holothuria leucospilota]
MGLTQSRDKGSRLSSRKKGSFSYSSMGLKRSYPRRKTRMHILFPMPRRSDSQRSLTRTSSGSLNRQRSANGIWTPSDNFRLGWFSDCQSAK